MARVASTKKTTVPVDSGTPVHINTGDIPAYVAVNLAQAASAAIHRAWENPEIRADYERWKEERRRSQKERTAHEAAQ